MAYFLPPIITSLLPLPLPQVMQSQAKMAGAMGSTAKTMAAVNKQVKVEDIQRTMMNFEKESTKMDMAGEMSEWKGAVQRLRKIIFG